MLRSRKMALEANSNHDGSNLDINVKGDLGNFQIIEEKSDSDDEDVFEDNNSRTFGQLSKLPAGVIHPSATPNISSVVVKDSENVQFGNNTHFHGPVTIKQVIRSNGEFDNSAYTKTEAETVTAPGCKQQASTNDIASPTRFKFQAWHKITLSALCLAIVAAICAIVSIILSDSTKDDKSTTNFQDDVPTDPLVIAPDHLRIVSRSDWLAQPVENKLDDIRQPVPWVIITHTATEECSSQSECVLRVRLIQSFHIESRKWYDIGYNFLVGGDGSAYYGRGWDYVGAHTLGYNIYSIGIAFIGTFNNKPPPKKQIEACQKLLNRGVKMGKLAKDYKLFAHRQLSSTLSPGDELYNIIKTWPHFAQNFTDIKELMPNY